MQETVNEEKVPQNSSNNTQDMLPAPTCSPPHSAMTILHRGRWDLDIRAEGQKTAIGMCASQMQCPAVSHRENSPASVTWGFRNQVPCTGGLQEQKLIFSRFWSLEGQDQGVRKMGFSPSLSPGLIDVHLHPRCSQGRPCVCVWGLISSPNKDTSQIGSGPTHGTAFYLNHLFQGPVSKYSHMLRS